MKVVNSEKKNSHIQVDLKNNFNFYSKYMRCHH